jgi:hypothetical protein
MGERGADGRVAALVVLEAVASGLPGVGLGALAQPVSHSKAARQAAVSNFI